MLQAALVSVWMKGKFYNRGYSLNSYICRQNNWNNLYTWISCKGCRNQSLNSCVNIKIWWEISFYNWVTDRSIRAASLNAFSRRSQEGRLLGLGLSKYSWRSMIVLPSLYSTVKQVFLPALRRFKKFVIKLWSSWSAVSHHSCYETCFNFWK